MVREMYGGAGAHTLLMARQLGQERFANRWQDARVGTPDAAVTCAAGRLSFHGTLPPPFFGHHAAVSTAPNSLIGQTIADRYHVLSLIGEGGMGRVYLAEHVKMGRKSALKVLSPEL